MLDPTQLLYSSCLLLIAFDDGTIKIGKTFETVCKLHQKWPMLLDFTTVLKALTLKWINTLPGEESTSVRTRLYFALQSPIAISLPLRLLRVMRNIFIVSVCPDLSLI